MKKKFLSFLLTLVMLFAAFSFTACDLGNLGDDVGEEPDTTKTHLYVVSYDGGWGIEWLNTMAREFEAMYEGHSFESGRQGIVVHVKGGKSDVTGDSVKSLMATSNYDVYFTTYNLRQYVLEDKLMDITDVVANTMKADYKKVWSDLGETGTIADKMDDTIKGYVQYAGANAAGVVDQTNVKYYGIPMYSSFYNINYDIDLFYEQGLYLKEDGTFCGGTVTTGATEAEINAEKSLGQDGIKGTEDDGLPITYQDWVNMCNKMTRQSISPICWSGNLGSYRLGYFNQFWANYEGADDWYINITGMGEDSEFGTITLDARNGYLTSGQAGRKASLKFAEDIIRENRWDTDASNGTDHYGSQDKFLQSKFYSERSESIKRIAMFIEGGWWENEAKTTIETMANQNGGEYVNRRFGVMTFPRMDDGHYTETKYPDADGNYTLSAPANVGDQGRKVNDMVLVSVTPDSNVAIRKNAKQVEASKLFLAYTTTEKCLRTYTRMTGSTRCYDYNLTSDDKAQMSTYKQQLWGYYSRAIKAGNVRYISGPGKFGEYNPQIVSGNYGICYNGLSFGGATYSAGDPITLFQNYGTVTAEEYFNGYKNFFSANNGAQWAASFCKKL